MNKAYKLLLALLSCIVITIAVIPRANAVGEVLSENKSPIAFDVIGEGNKKYEREFLKIKELNSPLTPAEGMYFYEPLYEYYSEEISTNNDSPEYVLIYAGTVHIGPAYVYGVYGDYIVQSGGYCNPYTLGYCVYLPESGEVLGLREAYDAGLAEIEKVFIDYGLGRLIGDLDADGKLTVKDATFIQKCLTGLCKYPNFDKVMGSHEPCEDAVVEYRYISDFNCDGERNIKDATAIQKHLAGLEY